MNGKKHILKALDNLGIEIYGGIEARQTIKEAADDDGFLIMLGYGMGSATNGPGCRSVVVKIRGDGGAAANVVTEHTWTTLDEIIAEIGRIKAEIEAAEISASMQGTETKQTKPRL